MSSVNYMRPEKIDTALYWAAIAKDARRAVQHIRAQRMALDLEAARWRRENKPGHGFLEMYGGLFSEMEKDLERFIDECDQKRQRRYDKERG